MFSSKAHNLLLLQFYLEIFVDLKCVYNFFKYVLFVFEAVFGFFVFLSFVFLSQGKI